MPAFAETAQRQLKPRGFIERRRKPRPAEPTADETIKETIESIVIAFILAFVFRAFIIEPFIIPTGSMAPTMLGTHAQVACPSCGYQFDIGIDQSQLGSDLLVPHHEVDCPMCNYSIPTQKDSKARAGDRILVDKLSYHFKEPARWDVVVFKAPQAQTVNNIPAPRSNFIKRLIGLPGERIVLLDGDVFIAPAGTHRFSIARKTDPHANRHWEKIQRAVWQPIYHSQYVPITDATADAPGRDELHVWRVPWVVESGTWHLGTARRPSRVYRFDGGHGEIRFEMSGDYGSQEYDTQKSKYPYNQTDGSINPIEDIRLAAALTPSSSQATLTLSTTARLDRPGSGAETIAARINTAGMVELLAIDGEGKERILQQTNLKKQLMPGIATEVELWFVDDEASVWINGTRQLTHPFDLTWDQIAARQPMEATPRVAIKVASDGPVELRRVELDRDLFYDPSGYTTGGYSRAQAKRIAGHLELGDHPLDLREASSDYDAEFFCVGDNQPGSTDGRDWSGVNAWIQKRHFAGQERLGVVPSGLLVGRAFMVYYPAPHGLRPEAPGVFPNFGRMRFVH